MVGSPVGEFAAGVFVPPAEVIVASLLDVVDFGGLSEPHVPVEVCRWCGFGEGSTGGAAVDSAGDFLDIT